MIELARAGELDVFVVGPPRAGESEQDERVRRLSALAELVLAAGWLQWAA